MAYILQLTDDILDYIIETSSSQNSINTGYIDIRDFNRNRNRNIDINNVIEHINASGDFIVIKKDEFILKWYLSSNDYIYSLLPNELHNNGHINVYKILGKSMDYIEIIIQEMINTLYNSGLNYNFSYEVMEDYIILNWEKLRQQNSWDIFEDSDNEEESIESENESTSDEVFEEDDDTENEEYTDSESIQYNMKECPNNSLYTLEKYDIRENDIFTIHVFNKHTGKFSNGACNSRTEMIDYLSAQNYDIPSDPDSGPSVITCIWKGGNESGLGGKPTDKFVIKMPPNNTVVTIGSVDRMLFSRKKHWYLIPLYNGKRRRIGYKYGISRNHGQTPGFIVYKAFTRDEIQNNVIVNTNDEYPLYIYKNKKESEAFNISNLMNAIIDYYKGRVLLHIYYTLLHKLIN